VAAVEAIQHETGTFEGASKVPIFYQRWLPATGARRGSIVLVHGLGEHGGRYTNLVRCLLPEGYAVYCLDHQGFGRSGGQRGHINRFTDYLPDIYRLVQMARAEQPGRPVAIFGHSMGGLISLVYALVLPTSVDYLVISAPALLANPKRSLVLLMRMMNLINPRFSIQRPGGAEGISRDPEEVRRFSQDPLYVGVSSARWAVEILATQVEVTRRAATLYLPILMLQGMADVIVVPQATVDFFQRVSSPDKTLHTYPGYYHELHNDLEKEKPLNDLVYWLNARIDRS
jgi:alpha-beta hydrolase superfamily lysophospholipase